MRKSLVISEQDSIAALLENDRVVEFFVNRGELLLGDIYTCSVENILPGIDAAFVNLGKDKMGFLHANDVPGQGPLKERLVPKQKLLVQITKEPTGHKGPRVSTAISLPGRFLVLVPEERGVSISRRISESRERARLKSVVNLMKPPGIGLIIRTEAKGQGEDELYEDFEQLWDTWQTIVSEAEASIGPTLIYRDQDLLYRVIRDAYSHEVTEIIVDSPDGQKRAQDYLQGWASKNTKVTFHTGNESLLVAKQIDREIESALTDRAELPSGGHLNIEPTEALTVIDVNSGRFTSSRTQAETVRRTNLEAAQEIPRQLRLRNIGGMVIVDFIDMESRRDQQQVLEVFQRVLEEDRAKPQIGQLSDLGLVELTRRRQGQSLRELFTSECSHCVGQGVIPDLEIGTSDNRKLITLKEDEPGRGQGRSSGKALKSASASSGRVVSTVSEPEPEAEEEFPDELLDQVPEDVFEDRGRGRRHSRHDFADDEDEEEISAEESAVEVSGVTFTPKSTLFEESLSEDEETSLTSDLTRSISEVEAVYNEMTEKVLPEELAGEMEDDVETVEPEIMVTEEEEEVFFESSSPHEAVEGPVSGVFTLKTKPETDADAPLEPAVTVPDAELERVTEEEARAIEASDSSGFFSTAGATRDENAVQGAVEVDTLPGYQNSYKDSYENVVSETVQTEDEVVLSSEVVDGNGGEQESASETYAGSNGAADESTARQEEYDQLKLATFATESEKKESED
ncbi:MAG: Rne/Rng family ribonuclease [Cyanobacteria bacterium HKST-UBA02]|nr:Rne/Rng family ribonuclease [Cyanobacteria bacterium HKST-UBA02]